MQSGTLLSIKRHSSTVKTHSQNAHQRSSCIFNLCSQNLFLSGSWHTYVCVLQTEKENERQNFVNNHGRTVQYLR